MIASPKAAPSQSRSTALIFPYKHLLARYCHATLATPQRKAGLVSSRFFGVGCIVPKVEEFKDPADWIEKVKAAFDAVPSVQKFKAVNVDDLNFHWAGDGYVEPEGQETQIPSSGMLTFEVNIPTRLQKYMLLANDEVEIFRVTILFHYVHPVTYIECLGAPGEVTHPSWALVVVREFLREELKKRDLSVGLLVIGPSPFHADFSLRNGTGPQPAGDGFSVEVEKSLAYDRITYFHESADSLRALYSSLQLQFSYFYRFTILRNMRLRAAVDLSDQSEEIAESFKGRGFRAYISRTLAVRQKLQSAQLDAVSARLTTTRHKRGSAEDLEGLYPGEEAAHLRGYLEKSMKEDYIEEIESAEKILDVLDGRHSQELQRFATITFSLLGVAFGALLTAAFRSWWG
ncbi:hypothetical protein [Streptomyces sp. NPDC127108]|uniref:hypothetical protein n=1 Tax=Streptomyces sp. NPDC127108 TaxID=3345361 RepID=UPI00362ACF22